jgi:hypothetical protein
MGKTLIPATSKDVRRYFVENPSKVPPGAEKSVQVSCKGRIKPNAIETFNKDKSHGMHYQEGTKRVTALTYKAKNHREVKVVLPTAEVRRLAGKPGSKGPLSKADKDFAVQMYLSSQS